MLGFGLLLSSVLGWLLRPKQLVQSQGLHLASQGLQRARRKPINHQAWSRDIHVPHPCPSFRSRV
jgi:hypothetical protein